MSDDTNTQIESLATEGDSDITKAAIQAAEAEERSQAEAKIGKSTIDSATAEEPSTAGRPEGIPEKFWKDGKLDQEALLASYAELEKKQSQGKPADGEKPEAEGEKPADGEKAADDAAKEIADAAGIDMDAYTDEFSKSGTLGEESRASILGKLEKGLGLTKENAEALLDGHLEGLSLRQNALSAQYEGDVKGAISDPSQYEAMIAWAAESLTPDQIKEFDEDVSSGNVRLAKRAVRDLFAQFKEGKAPDLVQPTAGRKGGEDVYAAKDEMIRDMQDARYEKDPAYRRQVDAKIERSAGRI